MTCQCICRPYAPYLDRHAAGQFCRAGATCAGHPERARRRRERQDLIGGSTGLEPGSKPQAQPTRNSQGQRDRLTLDRAVLANRGLM